jgi:hypothetical protein
MIRDTAYQSILGKRHWRLLSNNRKTKSIITQELFKLGVNGQK